MLVSAGGEKLAGCLPPIFQLNVCASVSVREFFFIVFSFFSVSAEQSL